MSWQAVEAVLRHSQSKSNARLVLVAIAHHAKPNGTGARPGVETLAAAAHINARMATRCLRQLESLGEIETELGGGRVANQYTILLPISSPAATDTPVSPSTAPRDGAALPPETGLPCPQGQGKQTVVETSVVVFNKNNTTWSEQLEAHGVASGTALELAQRFPDRLALQLDCLMDRSPNDAAATLVASIRGNWKPPASYLKRKQTERDAAAHEAERAREQERSTQRRQDEREAAASQAQEIARLDAQYESLDEERRAAIDAAAMERLGAVGRSGKAKGALDAMRRQIVKEREQQA